MEIERSIQDLKNEFEKKELISKISKIDESATKGKILITISGVGSFVLITVLFFYMLSSNARSDNNISAILSLLAGFFAAFLIMAVGGIIKEFSIKSGFIDVTSKLQEKIENVQTDIGQSKRDIEDKIFSLNQNLSQNIQSIDSKITNTNQNLNNTIRQAQMRMGNQNNNISFNPLTEEQIIHYVQEGVTRYIKAYKNFDGRDTEKILENAPTTEEVIIQKPVIGK